MKDYLKDLIIHTQSLDGIDLVKIVGTAKETQISALAEDKTVIVSGTFKTPIPDFEGVFGMPNLGKLSTILGFDDYDDDAIITMIKEKRDGVDVPSTIHFETKDGSFVNNYRLMSKSVIEEKIKNVSFRGATWNIDFEPSVSGIQRLKKQAQAHSEELHFSTKVEKGDLKIYFGDPSTHTGNFVFQAGVNGNLAKNWFWPVKQFIDIMNLVGDKRIRIADAGATEITVDSGLAIYTYMLPAQSK